MANLLLIIILLLISLGVLLYIAKELTSRLKKRYWELLGKVVEGQQTVQQQMAQIQQQMAQIQQQMAQIQQHLLLDQVGIMANLAKESDYINDSSYIKVIEAIHGLKMDNFSGENVKSSENP
ncbi:MAG: hypothetical protein A2Z47_04160 [Thermodesulfovibrio sp. RBG_19FT_COMBO_42_12]|nr:MAG: hypothetical protein A2Z47_04160 [Thermodesulfovibrio sp. RBG_19FT_COMBO_42_12]